MKNDNQPLAPDHLTTLDDSGNRLKVYTADVKGKHRTVKNWIQSILLVFFLVAPWIRVNGSYLVLLDFVNRKFILFGFPFFAHDAPLILLVATTFLFGVAVFTLLFGRVWCGYACPETVFTEIVFRKIERWIEGNSIDQKNLDQPGWTLEKITKKSAKWSIYFCISLAISHIFLAYFFGTDGLLRFIDEGVSQHPTVAASLAFITAIVLFAFGWFREQFCVVMCPYGRLQSVLMDSNSFSVLYDINRGEPRRNLKDKMQQHGDCIDCFKCVAVCPTKIDIRDGNQMECVHCTACMDACDSVMEKTGKPKGLIRYESLSALKNRKTKILRPRLFILVAGFAGSFLLLGYFIVQRPALAINILRAKDTPYQVVKSDLLTEKVINHFQIRLSSHSLNKAQINYSAEDPNIEVIGPILPNHIESGAEIRADFFLKFSNSRKEKKTYLLIAVTESDQTVSKYRKEIRLVGPNL